jgi:hypothetical protein
MAPNAGTGRRQWNKIFKRLAEIPKNLLQHLYAKSEALQHSAAHQNDRVNLHVPKHGLAAIKKSLKPSLAHVGHSHQHAISPAEKKLVQEIKQRTLDLNRNNVTRTEAYRSIYEAHPELHWALLAHMVSRNGGWNMTDLKGDLLPRLMTKDQAEHLFLFLERANALIFQDAYPQLLLYQESVKRSKNMFHLLPEFYVSAFMGPFWEHFYMHRNPVLLTIALIVNEQNYIERRVVQNAYFRENVVDTLLFKTQSLLQLNHVIFPFVETGAEGAANPCRLAGLVVEDFADIKERIEVGKTLYSILFGYPHIFQGAELFARERKHTGSRADYWPHIFAKVHKAPPGRAFSERLDGCRLKDDAPPLYSPELTNAWKDRPVDPPERFDWFTDMSPLKYFGTLTPPFSYEMTEEYCFGLNKIELAVLGEQQL